LEIRVKYLEDTDQYMFGMLDDYGNQIPFNEAEAMVVKVLQDFIDVYCESGSQPLLRVIDGGKDDTDAT